jgi:adenylyl cyclase-associated protein
MGVVPTITIDKVDGMELYLGKESLNCEIIHSKSSGINISVPDSRTGDYVSQKFINRFFKKKKKISKKKNFQK